MIVSHEVDWFTMFFCVCLFLLLFFFFSSRRRHTRYWRDWSSDVCSSDLRCFWWMGVALSRTCNWGEYPLRHTFQLDWLALYSWHWFVSVWCLASRAWTAVTKNAGTLQLSVRLRGLSIMTQICGNCSHRDDGFVAIRAQFDLCGL